MAGQLTGQRAFVTGGASGIGAEMARRFTAEGATVVISDVNDTLGKEVAKEIGGTYVHLTRMGAAAMAQNVATHILNDPELRKVLDGK
jgi:NAD(P)-dependent dehydrogenase (short-subunit alcohol dehydrogenase family)